MITGREELQGVVRYAVRKTRAADVYTRLTPRALVMDVGRELSTLFTSPELVCEALKYPEFDPEAKSQEEKVNAVFAALFVNRSPIGAQAQSVLWTLERLGLDVGVRDLDELRQQWPKYNDPGHVSDILDLANLSRVAVQIPLLEEAGRPVSFIDDRLEASLCLDILAHTDEAWARLSKRGCRSHDDVYAFIVEAAQKVSAASLLMTEDFSGPFFERCVVPASKALGIPLLQKSALSVGLIDATQLACSIHKNGWAQGRYGSGASSLIALPGIWKQARKAVAQALVEAYTPLIRCGWRLSEAEIEHDIEQMLGNR